METTPQQFIIKQDKKLIEELIIPFVRLRERTLGTPHWGGIRTHDLITSLLLTYQLTRGMAMKAQQTSKEETRMTRCWKVCGRAQAFFLLCSNSLHGSVTETFLLLSASVRNRQVFCFERGQTHSFIIVPLFILILARREQVQIFVPTPSLTEDMRVMQSVLRANIKICIVKYRIVSSLSFVMLV